MKDIIKEKKLCTGCAACAQACPRNAVEMTANNEGFAYPEVIDEKCSDCGLCVSVCPVNNALENPDNKNINETSKKVKVYGCYSNDSDLRANSSSGGIFSLLAEKVLEENGAVFGAEFDEDFNVRHTYIESSEKLDSLRRSKYVQSNIGSVYKEVKCFLEQGRKVLFCGTPCQVAGLKACLRKEYAGLLTCDLACHGVPSPRVWQMYLDYMRNKYQSDISAVSFRDKTNGWKLYNMCISFANGQQYRVKANNELYFIGFGKNVFNRRSCFNCSFRINNTKADLTLADFWGIGSSKVKEFTDNKGVSLVITGTEAGASALASISDKMFIIERSLQEATTGNPRLVSSCMEPAGRKMFFQDMDKGLSFDQLRRKYMDNYSIKYRLKTLIKLVLSPDTISKAKKVLKR